VKIIDRIQATSAREARKNVTTGIVKSIDFDRMNVIPAGSKGMLRSVRIIGDPNTVAVGDAVSLMFTESETVAMVNAVTTNPSFLATNHALTHSRSGADPITPQMIGAAPLVHTHDASDIGNLLSLVGNGVGDMTKSIYDTNGDGVVDNADKLDGVDGSLYERTHISFVNATNTFNQALTQGEYEVNWVGAVLGTGGAPYTGNLYGKLKVTVNNGLTDNLSTSWLWQYFDTTAGLTYMRYKINADAWSVWCKVWNGNNDGAGSGSDADLLDGLEATAFERVYSGTCNADFNLALTQGEYKVQSSVALNAPLTGAIYGKLRVIVSDGTTHNNVDNWIWQYLDTTVGDTWTRYKSNSGAWHTWEKIINTASIIKTPEIDAKDASGLKLFDDGGKGIFIQDGGNVNVGAVSSTPAKMTISAPDSSISPGFSLRQLGTELLYGYDFDLEQTSVGRLDISTLTNGVKKQAISILRGNANVGIGTINPLAPLDIRDPNSSGSAGTLSPNTQLYIRGAFNGSTTDATYGRIFLGVDENRDYGISLGARRAGGGGLIHMVLGVKASGTLVEAIDIANDGKVGIGINNPTSKLEVNGQIQIPNQNYLLGRSSDATSIAMIGIDGTDNLLIGSGNKYNAIQFSTGGASGSKFVTMRNGQVGIGTTNPQSILEVRGNISTPWAVVFQHYQPDMETANVVRPYFSKSWKTGIGNYLYLGETGNSSNTVNTAMLLSQNLGVLFGKGSDSGDAISTEWMRINASGDVGIGTSSPAAKLDVVGSGQFSGSIFPALSDVSDIGSNTKFWRKAFVSEFDAFTLATGTTSVVGGWLMLAKGEGTLALDLAAASTTFDFGKTMTPGHFVLMRAVGQVEYIQIGTLVSGTNYNITRNLDGSGANLWPAGTTYAILGTNGDGRIELNSSDTPRISVINQGATYSAQTEIMRFGDLDGMPGVAGQTWGMYIGDASQYLKFANGVLSISGNGSGLTSIDGGHITSGSITANKLAVNCITAAQIAAGTITATEIMADTITSNKIKANTILAGNISAGAITAAAIGVNEIVANTANIKDGVITTAKIGLLQVTGATIADATITTAKIADLQVTNAKIADATIASAKIASLDAAKITSGYIDAARINAGTITVDKLASGTLGVSKTLIIGPAPVLGVASSRLELATTSGNLATLKGIYTDAAGINHDRAYFDTDGKLYAGGGDVVLDENGIGLNATSTSMISNQLSWNASGSSYALLGTSVYNSIVTAFSIQSFVEMYISAKNNKNLHLTTDKGIGGLGDVYVDIADLIISGGSLNIGSSRIINSYGAGLYVPIQGISVWNGISIAVGDWTYNITSSPYNLPANTKAVMVRTLAKWSAASANSYQLVRRNGTETYGGLAVWAQVANIPSEGAALVPIDADHILKITVGGANTTASWVVICGYVI
jgi:hypothetical protein